LHAVARRRSWTRTASLWTTENYYDDPTFSGANFGQITKGELTLAAPGLDPTSETNFTQTMRNSYALMGNILRVLDPLAGGPWRKRRSHSMPATVRNSWMTAVSTPIPSRNHPRRAAQEALTIRANSTSPCHNRLLGGLQRRLQNHYGYDTFGRLVNDPPPRRQPRLSKRRVRLFPSPTLGPSGIVNYVETRLLDKEEFTTKDTKSTKFYQSVGNKDILILSLCFYG